MIKLPAVNLKDDFGFTHNVDLNEVPFILQKKAKPTKVVISQYLVSGNKSARKRFLQSNLCHVCR